MKATELRIGNLIMFSPSGKASIKPRAVVVLRILENSCIVSDLGLEIQLFYDSVSTKPMPLSEEWLLKFGFGKSARPNCEDIYKDLTARMILWFNEGNYAEMDLIQDDKRISFRHSHIKFVHQLQNLYFALTGDELLK